MKPFRLGWSIPLPLFSRPAINLVRKDEDSNPRTNQRERASRLGARQSGLSRHLEHARETSSNRQQGKSRGNQSAARHREKASASSETPLQLRHKSVGVRLK